MSGFVGAGVYELTATKAEFWHRYRGCCGSLAAIVATHLVPAGFKAAEGHGGGFWRVTGPGLARQSTDELYEAISGRPGGRGGRAAA